MCVPVAVKCLRCGALIEGVRTPPAHIIRHVAPYFHIVDGVEFWPPSHRPVGT